MSAAKFRDRPPPYRRTIYTLSMVDISHVCSASDQTTAGIASVRGLTQPLRDKYILPGDFYRLSSDADEYDGWHTCAILYQIKKVVLITDQFPKAGASSRWQVVMSQAEWYSLDPSALRPDPTILWTANSQMEVQEKTAKNRHRKMGYFTISHWDRCFTSESPQTSVLNDIHISGSSSTPALASDCVCKKKRTTESEEDNFDNEKGCTEWIRGAKTKREEIRCTFPLKDEDDERMAGRFRKQRGRDLRGRDELNKKLAGARVQS
ncbi:hypothetical protein F5141DRAFT_1200279 [Pisolithus sp. B1]|nr:hypothetical protein F5141DRAFT_1200279 [Pisolithus sp. B1]